MASHWDSIVSTLIQTELKNADDPFGVADGDLRRNIAEIEEALQVACSREIELELYKINRWTNVCKTGRAYTLYFVFPPSVHEALYGFMIPYDGYPIRAADYSEDGFGTEASLSDEEALCATLSDLLKWTIAPRIAFLLRHGSARKGK